MKRIIIFCALMMIGTGCTSGSRDDWDSGAQAKRDAQQQRMEEMSENTNIQFPTETPGTERNQPF